MPEPFFSVLVTAYNRAEHALRCVNSCRQQTFEDFEIVLVDDGSTDATGAVLAALEEPRLRIVYHGHNRGISAARATAVDHARGEWVVMIDSDWELMPHALERLRQLISGLPPGVRIIRSRIQWDDGRVSPAIMPAGIADYRDRLRWHEALAIEETASDAGECIHRSVFDTVGYFADRRGATNGSGFAGTARCGFGDAVTFPGARCDHAALWELDVARQEPSLFVPDILGVEHSDAPNSHTRDTSTALLRRLLSEAPDFLWMAETILAEHADGLARDAPHYRVSLMQCAARDAFLAGRRLRGIRHSWDAARAGGASRKLSAIFIFGMLGPRALAHATMWRRRTRAGRREMAAETRRTC
jgi:Glycosyl transferase family 2